MSTIHCRPELPHHPILCGGSQLPNAHTRTHLDLKMNSYIDPRLEQDLQHTLDLIKSGRIQLAHDYLQQILLYLNLPTQDWNPGDPNNAA